MPKFSLLLPIALSYTFSLLLQAAEEIHTYGPITSGDMLWNIAAKVSPPSVSRHQVILALQRANPHAFRIPCNMNSLKVGETLRIPSLIEMQALTRDEAIKEFNRQDKEWQNRRQTPIVCPPSSTKTENTPTQTAGESITEPVADSEIQNEKSTMEPTTLASSSPTTQPRSISPKREETSATPQQQTQLESPEPTATNQPVAQVNALAPQSEELVGNTVSRNGSTPPQVALVPEPENTEPVEILPTMNDSAPDVSPAWSSPMKIALFTIGAIILILLLFWLLRRKTIKPTIVEDETLESYTISDPIAEMPLQLESIDKLSNNK